jgi:hypothetical protein
MIMKYWGYLAVKLVVAAVLLRGLWGLIRLFLSQPDVFFGLEQRPFAHDLGYTTAMMVFFLVSAGVLYLVVWDQRYRCRACLRRLRMPIAAGSWPNMLLFGQPRMEYICIYGHGTLKVPEVQITGSKSPDWEPHHDDIWKELESLEESNR